MIYRHTYDERTGVAGLIDALEYPILTDPPHARRGADGRAVARTDSDAMGWRGLLSKEYSKQIRSDRKAARPEGLTDDHLSLRAECVFFNGAYLPYSVDALPLLQSRTLGDAVQNREGTHDYNGRRRFGRRFGRGGDLTIRGSECRHADHNGGRRASDRDDVEDFIDLGSGHSESELFSEDRSRGDDLYGDDDESRSDGSEVADSYVRPKAPETTRKREAGRKRSTAPHKKNRRKNARPSRTESQENIGSISCASFLPPPFLCKVVDVKKALKAYADTVPIDTICDIVLGRVAESTSGDARSETSSDSHVSLVDSAITHRAPIDASAPVRASVIVETMEKITTFVKSLGAESSDKSLAVDDFRMTGRTRDGVSEESVKRSLRQAFEQYFDGTHDTSIEVLEARKEVHHWITKLARRVRSRSDWAAKGDSCGYWTLLFHEVDRRARNYMRCDLFHLRKREESEHETRCREFDRDALDAEVRGRLSSALFRKTENFDGATFDARSVVKDQLVLLFFAREPKDLVQMFNDRDLASLQHIRDSAGLSMIDLFDSHMVQP
eukprot:gene28324-35087_t